MEGREVLQGGQRGGDLSSLTWWEGRPGLGPAGAQMDGSSTSGRSRWRGRHPWRQAGGQRLHLILCSLFPPNQAHGQESTQLGDLLSLAIAILRAIKHLWQNLTPWRWCHENSGILAPRKPKVRAAGKLVREIVQIVSLVWSQRGLLPHMVTCTELVYTFLL